MKRYNKSTFEARYPYNQSTITRSGHEFHINDTPGHESLRAAHTSGTHVEIESDGSWRTTILGRLFEYVKQTVTRTIESHVDEKIGGVYTRNIDQSSFETVGRDRTTGCGGNSIDAVSKNRETYTGGESTTIVAGSASFLVSGNSHVCIEGNQTRFVGRNDSTVVQQEAFFAAENIELSASNLVSIKCKTLRVEANDAVHITAGQTVIIETQAGPITITAQGIVYINGQQIRLND